jgi:hypothetical protein
MNAALGARGGPREGSQPRIQYGQHLLARHVELFDPLVDAAVFEVRPAHPTIK